MFIVALLVLTVLLSYVLADAAGEAAVVRLPNYGVEHQSYKAFARDLILSNRFWIYLVLGIGATLLVSTTVAVALIMQVKTSVILASAVSALLFAVRAFFIKKGSRRSLLRTLQVCGACGAAYAFIELLRP